MLTKDSVYESVLVFFAGRYFVFPLYEKQLTDLFDCSYMSIGNISSYYKTSFLVSMFPSLLMATHIPLKNCLYFASFVSSFVLLFLAALFNGTLEFRVSLFRLGVVLLAPGQAIPFAVVLHDRVAKTNKHFRGLVSASLSVLFCAGAVTAEPLLAATYNFLFDGYFGTDAQTRNELSHFLQTEAVFQLLLFLGGIAFLHTKPATRPQFPAKVKTLPVLVLFFAPLLAAILYFGSRLCVFLGSNYVGYEAVWHKDLFLVLTLFAGLLTGVFIDSERNVFSALFPAKVAVAGLFAVVVLHLLSQSMEIVYVTAANALALGMVLPSLFCTLVERFGPGKLAQPAAVVFAATALANHFLALFANGWYDFFFTDSVLGDGGVCVKNDCYKPGEIGVAFCLALAQVAMLYIPKREKAIKKHKLRTQVLASPFVKLLIESRSVTTKKTQTTQRCEVELVFEKETVKEYFF